MWEMIFVVMSVIGLVAGYSCYHFFCWFDFGLVEPEDEQKRSSDQ